LRLSGETIFKIFTGEITNWDNPAITHDYGSQLPSMPITPVVPAGGDGATYYFTNWLAHVYPHQWNAFCDSVHRWIRPPCGPTEIYPQVGNAQAVNVGNPAKTVMSDSGAIGFGEYSYALQGQVPVVYVRNPAGRYVLPLSGNVTAALSRAGSITWPHSGMRRSRATWYETGLSRSATSPATSRRHRCPVADIRH
jgi:ABC-type phosphate transport system substrate-binding protein